MWNYSTTYLVSKLLEALLSYSVPTCQFPQDHNEIGEHQIVKKMKGMYESLSLKGVWCVVTKLVA